MTLALGTAGIVLVALLWELMRPRLTDGVARRRLLAAARRRRGEQIAYDPGRELRAEQRARSLLASCIEEEDWAMYRDLGFLRVWGGAGGRGAAEAPAAAAAQSRAAAGLAGGGGEPGEGTAAGGSESPSGSSPARAGYAYLIYPHKPIVAYVPETGALLNEYCVAFPDHSKPFGSARLPDSDDVLAKWMALAGDERRLIADANMHLPGRQVDPERVQRDLQRLERWERERGTRRVDSVRAA